MGPFLISNQSSIINIVKLIYLLAIIYCVATFMNNKFKETQPLSKDSDSSSCPYKKWEGFSPSHSGSCWCDKISPEPCFCTPSLAIEAIMEYKTQSNVTKLIFIQRRDPPVDTLAIPGGFVEVGESVENALKREIKEETNMTINRKNCEQFKLFSTPNRDYRRHTVSIIFRCIIEKNMLKSLQHGDDAKRIIDIDINKVFSLTLAVDNKKVLSEYIIRYHS